MYQNFPRGSTQPASSTSLLYIPEGLPCPTKSTLHFASASTYSHLTLRAGALFNAVKKQYGLHAFILPLSLPSPPPPPVPVPALPPRLPPPSSETWQNGSPPNSRPHLTTSPLVSPNFLSLSEPDIQQLARFTREFVVMSLVPWMEKCVLDWNEAYSSSRRLPSRFFSSTRKLFGSSVPPTQNPTHTSSSSISSLPSRSHTLQLASGSNVLIPPPTQLQRLAEFATILGDYKLAIAVWESLRKENKGGSVIPAFPT